MIIKKFNSPILIIGFHHSGTRLLSDLLINQGVYQIVNGKTSEWSYIQDLNNNIWKHWNKIDNISIDKIGNNKNIINKFKLFKNLIFLGYRGGLWGHKDPRTCITVSAWKKKFPNAKIIHLIRNPLDVIGTLTDNYQEFDNKNLPPRKNTAFWIKLWVKTLDFFYESVKSDNFFELRYEDLCEYPKKNIKEICNYLEIKYNSAINLDYIKPAVNKYKTWIEEGKISEKNIEIIKDQAKKYIAKFDY